LATYYKIKESFYILGYILELIIKIWQSGTFFFFSKIWQIRAIFFPWKFLCIGWNHILQVEIWWNFTNWPKKQKPLELRLELTVLPSHPCSFGSTKKKVFWQGNVCMFVILYLLDWIEQKFIEFRNDLRLWNGLDPSVWIHSRSKTLPDHGLLIWLLGLFIAKIYSRQQVNKAYVQHFVVVVL
jgi:hypothetical protein